MSNLGTRRGVAVANENPIPGKAKIVTRAATRSTLGDIKNTQALKPTTTKPTLQTFKKPSLPKDVLKKTSLSGISKNTARNTTRPGIVTRRRVSTSLPRNTADDGASTSRPSSPQPMIVCQPENAFNQDSFSTAQLSLLGIDDPDKEDRDNPQLVTEIVNDIYRYLRELEAQQRVKEGYLNGRDITPRMRGILVDWLVQVHIRFKLLAETLYLCVAILDRFLQDNEISKGKLQLAGITALYIASKYEEMYPPEIGDYAYITDNSFSTEEIRKMEMIMLKELNFGLGRPLPLHFLRRFTKIAQAAAETHMVAKYLMELALCDYDVVHVDPSVVAAGALCLAMHLVESQKWTNTLEFFTTYKLSDISRVVNKLAAIWVKFNSHTKLQAVKSKYASGKFIRISSHFDLYAEKLKEVVDLGIESL